MPAHGKQLDWKRIDAFLAEESQVPIADVAILYEHERAELAVGADTWAAALPCKCRQRFFIRSCARAA